MKHTQLPESAVSIILSYDIPSKTCYQRCDRLFTNNPKLNIHPWAVVHGRILKIKEVSEFHTYDLMWFVAATVDLHELESIEQLKEIDLAIQRELKRMPTKKEAMELSGWS